MKTEHSETWEQYVTRVTGPEPGQAPRETSKDNIIDFGQLEETQKVATLNELSEGLHISVNDLENYRRHTDRLKLATFNPPENLASDDEGESSALSDSQSPDRIQTAEDYKIQLEKAFIG